MPVKLDTLLEQWGFQQNPFATDSAERERDLLPAWFCRSDLFDLIVGDPARPASCLLFAPTGYGKTSHRIEVARRVRERLASPALPVTLTEFDAVLNGGADALTLDSYLDLIRALVLEALAQELDSSERRRQLLQAEPMAYARFCALLSLYAPDRAVNLLMPANLMEPVLQTYRKGGRGAAHWLADLVSLARAAGFASIYVLVDGVDELNATRGDPDLMAQLLAPLLNAPGILQGEGLAFKFFLPSTLRARLEAPGVARLDRLEVYALEWTTTELVAMLSRRLSMSSQRTSTSSGLTHCFADLCDADFDVDEHLAQAAGSSPRELLKLVRAIILNHSQRASSPDELIAAATILEVAPHHEVAPRAASAPPAPPRVVLAPSGPPLLYLNDRGEIMLGEQRLERRPSRLLFLCLSYLWANRHRVVRREELAAALYANDSTPVARADALESAFRVVCRLREFLEPTVKNSHTYIDVQTGIGYVLRHFREDE